jgi:RimJ/RimL family protein N-acetyltransferase
VTRYLSWPPARTQLDSDEAMKRRLARIAAGEEVSWIVVERRSDAVVAAIHVALDGDSGELGFAFARVFWGRGFASEAARAVAEWSLAPGRLSKLRATCDAENRASLRVLEKIGMRSQRLVAAHAVHPNIGPEARDCHVLSMDARDLERAVQLSRAGVE